MRISKHFVFVIGAASLLVACNGIKNKLSAKTQQPPPLPVPPIKAQPLPLMQTADLQLTALDELVLARRLLPPLIATPPMQEKSVTDGCIQHTYSRFPDTYLSSDFAGCTWENPASDGPPLAFHLSGHLDFINTAPVGLQSMARRPTPTPDTPATQTPSDDPPANTRFATGTLSVSVQRAATHLAVKTTRDHEFSVTFPQPPLAAGEYAVSWKTTFGKRKTDALWAAKMTNAKWIATTGARGDGTPDYQMKANSIVSVVYSAGANSAVYRFISDSAISFSQDANGCLRPIGKFTWEAKTGKAKKIGGSIVTDEDGITGSDGSHRDWSTSCMP